MIKIYLISFLVLQIVSGQSENCISENQVIFEGRCVDLFEDNTCKEQGKRLYENENGEVRCDCLEDKWLSKNGKCYQEFTQHSELCPRNQIIKLREFGLEYDCIDNPCESGKAPHRYHGQNIFDKKYSILFANF